jgi:UDP-N-acetylmuramyl tripeptide synthase
VAAERIELLGMEGSPSVDNTPEGSAEIRLPLPGLYTVYNAMAAVAAALELGVALPRIASALAEVEAVFGRVETIEIEGKSLSIFLIKNPAGANEVLRTLAQEASVGSGDAPDDPSADLDIWFALNDNIADGRDVSWIWDADFELLAGSVRRVTCAGTRAAEMALRLKYAGWPTAAIITEPDISDSLAAARVAAPGRLFALPTYTALIELRTMLAKRGLAKDYWE